MKIVYQIFKIEQMDVATFMGFAEKVDVLLACGKYSYSDIKLAEAELSSILDTLKGINASQALKYTILPIYKAD